MGDVGPIIFLIVITVLFFRFSKYYKTELRYKFYEVQKEFERNSSYKNVFIFRESGQYKTDGTITAEFKSYHISVAIKGDKTLQASLKAYTLGDNQALVIVEWEPIRLAYSSLTHIAGHLVRQTSEILSKESNIKYDGKTLSVSYKRDIPVQKKREYERDLDSWFRTTHNYYD